MKLFSLLALLPGNTARVATTSRGPAVREHRGTNPTRRKVIALLSGALGTLHAGSWDPGCARAEPAAVVVVLSDQTAPYQEVTTGLRERLRGSTAAGVRIVTIGWQEFARHSTSPRPTVTIAVGVKAMQTVASARPAMPVICGLIPQRAYEVVIGRGASRDQPAAWTAVYLDQPLARQLDLMRLILPARQRIGVLLGSESEAQLDELTTQARDRRMTLNTQVIASGDELAAALQRAAETSDAIWMLPDSAISNPNTVRDLLLASYRHKRPVIGFSQGYVRAGALAAVYSTPTQIGGELAGMLLQVLANPTRTLPPRHPAEYEVALNFHVARAYGLQLDDEPSVLKKLRALERQP